MLCHSLNRLPPLNRIRQYRLVRVFQLPTRSAAAVSRVILTPATAELLRAR